MKLTALPDDLILEVASHLEVFGGCSLSVSCRQFRKLSLRVRAYWLAVLINQQKVEPSRYLPLAPYQDIKKLSVAQLHDVAFHMVKLEKNLSRKRPILRHPPTQVMIEDIDSYMLHNIPGTPLLLLGLHENQLACFDYEQRRMLCTVKASREFMQVSPLCHERGKCCRVIQIGIQRSENPYLSMLYVNYHLDSATKQWEASMKLVPIPTPTAGPQSHDKLQLPDYLFGDAAVVTDSKVVAYTLGTKYAQDADGRTLLRDDRLPLQKLEIAAVNVATGMSTRIDTEIHLHSWNLISCILWDPSTTWDVDNSVEHQWKYATEFTKSISGATPQETVDISSKPGSVLVHPTPSPVLVPSNQHSAGCHSAINLIIAFQHTSLFKFDVGRFRIATRRPPTRLKLIF
ncbi:hypothetical protein V5O48_016269 [Marasmius crinis-equi]|uniref:F-box domain-containing protein n=1 Tax=Marasmius crinis-equi TaxID=585013 RepID=A0ABR3ES68_9AGAR